MYRQKKYILKKYLEIEVFLMPEKTKPFSKAKKIQETSPAQKKLNNKKSIKYFNRLIHKNFDENDLAVDLTFDEKHLPANRAEAIRKVKNYIERVRRKRRKLGLPELKYVHVISDSDEFGNKISTHAPHARRDTAFHRFLMECQEAAAYQTKQQKKQKSFGNYKMI